MCCLISKDDQQKIMRARIDFPLIKFNSKRKENSWRNRILLIKNVSFFERNSWICGAIFLRKLWCTKRINSYWENYKENVFYILGTLFSAFGMLPSKSRNHNESFKINNRYLHIYYIDYELWVNGVKWV